jgi:hypothetical protein
MDNGLRQRGWTAYSEWWEPVQACDELRERSSFLTAVGDGKVTHVFEKRGLRPLPQAVANAHGALREPRPGGRRPVLYMGLYRVSTEGATLRFHDPSPGCGEMRAN